jgi:hypothetical protein
VDGDVILQSDSEMGLKQQDMQHLHARLRFKGLQQISTCRPQASTTYPILVCHARLWRQDSVCHKGWNTPTHGLTMSHNLESHRICSILCTRGRSDLLNATQWYCKETNQGDWKISFKHPKPSRRSVFIGKQIPRARYPQRIHPRCRFRNQKCGCLRSRIRSWDVLSQRPKWCPTQSYTHRAGPHRTPDASPHG